MIAPIRFAAVRCTGSPKAAFVSHCGMTLTSLMMPTDTAEVKLVNHVRFTWNTSRQRLSKSSRCTPLDGYDCSAVHQAGLEVWCTMEYCDNATCPPSNPSAKMKVTNPEMAVFNAVNSTAVILPAMRLLASFSSATPARRKVTQKANAIGVIRFTTSAMAGMSNVTEASKLTIMAPIELRKAAAPPTPLKRSPLTILAKSMVHKRSVD
mmetsp:Transcript_23091/g.53051  ORF Transcript_23091/g.53051 Transcript_23091/m.53051 type:complete len:208 (-) Transcript_23091:622-1245(-)